MAEVPEKAIPQAAPDVDWSVRTNVLIGSLAWASSYESTRHTVASCGMARPIHKRPWRGREARATRKVVWPGQVVVWLVGGRLMRV